MMGKRIALILLILLLVGGAIWQNSYIKTTAPLLLSILDETAEYLKQEDYENALSTADRFLDTWEKEKPTYEALFEHKEVDIITATAKSIRSLCETQEQAHALSEIEAVSYYIHHIETMDGVRWQNIL